MTTRGSALKYTKDLIVQALLQNTAPIDTPLELNVKYQKDDGNWKPSYKSYGLSEACWKSYLLDDHSAIYFSCGQFMNQTMHHHFSAVKCIIHYLLGTLEHDIFFPAHSNMILTAYCDADQAGCPDIR